VRVDRAIGLVVPLSGVMAAFGNQVEQGTKLALDLVNAGLPVAKRVHLVVADEGEDTVTAAAAATDLVENQHVIGVLGPLSSDSAAALVPLLSTLRTPLLSSSATRPDLAGVSPWFFRDALSPEKQATAMADYAVTARRLTRVATLAPDDYYGTVSAQAFSRRVRALGGVVVAAATYTAGTSDFRQAMLALGGVDPGIEKSVDQDEMRDQQEKVEEACNAIGKALRRPATGVQENLSAVPQVRLLVVDFAQDTACAKLNAGRAFADRFARTLSQLGGVDVIGPQAALRYWTPLTTSAEALTPVQAAEAAQAAGADFVLTGWTAALPPNPVKWPNRGVYSLETRLLDALTATTCARKDFTWTQYQAPPSNSLGLQALYLPASAEDVNAVVPDMQFFDLSLPLLGSDQWDRPELRDHLPELEGDVFTTAYWGASPDTAVKHFDAAYRAAYAAKPDVLAAQAFDAATLMAKAIL
ncbi:MAG: ABC transporter substrate-binding protein, partial [bacterium]